VTEILEDDAPKGAKARTGSLLKSMQLDTVTVDDALKLLSLPRIVGVHPEKGEQITAQNGRYGPYLKMGSDSRSLEHEEQLFTITLDEAVAVFAQPKTRGGRAAAGPLKELGEDPASKKPVQVKEGRFGPYVTDGEFNATLRKGDSVETITLERAAELLAEKRAKGPAPKKRAAKKSAAKKSTAKKSTAKKSPAKKS
jgi:DNA topoisomerase-1